MSVAGGLVGVEGYGFFGNGTVLGGLDNVLIKGLGRELSGVAMDLAESFVAWQCAWQRAWWRGSGPDREFSGVAMGMAESLMAWQWA